MKFPGTCIAWQFQFLPQKRHSFSTNDGGVSIANNKLYDFIISLSSKFVPTVEAEILHFLDNLNITLKNKYYKCRQYYELLVSLTLSKGILIDCQT